MDFLFLKDYFLIGDTSNKHYLEGKNIYTNLGPLVNGEFTMNTIFYDFKNKLIIDKPDSE